MFGGKKYFHFLVWILISAITISLIFHIFFRQNQDVGFSEIYFSELDSLPNEVVIGNEYNFSFTIRNLENEPSTYEHRSIVELFNLYDTTEGIYRCVSQQRKKVQLRWLEGNESVGTIFLIQKNNSNNAAFIYSDTDEYGSIDWPSYNIQFIYENVLGGGSFTIFFYYDDFIRYSITLNEEESEVELFYRNHNKTSFVKENVTFKEQNKVLINISNSLKLHINDRLVVDINSTDLINGEIGFRMDNSLVLLGNLIVYKISPVGVTLSRYIREYDIDNSLIIKKIEEFMASTKEDLYLIRNLLNLSEIKCNNNECNKLKSFLNNPQNIYTLNFNYSINETDTLRLLDDKQTTLLPSYAVTQNTTSTEIVWPFYNIKMNFQILVKPHTFIVSFTDFMIMLHNSNIFLIIHDNNATKIQRRVNPAEIGINELFIESENNNFIVYINNIPIFNFYKEIRLNKISLYTKNTFMIFDDIVVINEDKGCKNSFASKECRRVYVIAAEKSLSTEETSVLTQPLKLSVGLSLIPFLGATKIFDFETNESKLLPKPSIAQLINYEIEVNRSQFNENIPSERYSFDGKSALLVNLSNYSFRFNFNVLDGIRIIENSFYGNDRIEIAKLIINQPKNEVYLFTNFKGTLVKNTAYLNVSRYDTHKYELLFEQNKSIYYIDDKKIFEINGIDMSNGFFSISTYNTYADITDIVLFNRVPKKYIPFIISADPCNLRKIKEMIISKGSLYLDDEEHSTINQSFVINDDFDFGLVSVTLKQANRNDTEIHFWVLKNE